MKHRLLFLLILFSISAQAQTSAGILDPSRAIDWSKAGIVGGIPSGSWAQCGSTIPAGSSAATIQNTINNCPANHYVLLGAGTFNLSTGLNMKSNVVLRGAGANQTFLTFTGTVSCYSAVAAICITGDLYTYSNSGNNYPGQPNGATWSGGYSQGATSITLTNVGSTGIVNGQYIYLDQANDTSIGSGLFICDETSPACSSEGGAPGMTRNGVNYSQLQVVQVTAGCASKCIGVGPFTLTISPGLYGSNWRSSQTPNAWWPSATMQYAGVENMSINNQTGMGDNGETIGIFNASNCWVSGVALLHGGRAHIWIIQGAHNQIQSNYFYQTQDAQSQSYGVELDMTSDNLVVNNIMQQVTAPLMGGAQFGNSLAYNYMINDYQTVSASCMYPVDYSHDAGAEYNLLEGNFAEVLEADVVHGTQGLNTLFRNVVTGYELGKSCATIALTFDPFSRFENVVGNVLGTPGKTITYQNDPNQEFVVYDIGQAHQIAADPVVGTTMLRWGNYDNVTGAVRWCGNSSNTGWATACGGASEVPTGISSYRNAVPSLGDKGTGQNPMPASFIYSSAPSWWPSGKPWPAIGPDVTNGNLGQCSGGSYASLFATASGQCNGGTFSANVNGGHANSIPAQDCYLNVMHGPLDGSGGGLSFNASQCYGSSGTSGGGGGTSPGVPTGLTATAK